MFGSEQTAVVLGPIDWVLASLRAIARRAQQFDVLNPVRSTKNQRCLMVGMIAVLQGMAAVCALAILLHVEFGNLFSGMGAFGIALAGLVIALVACSFLWVFRSPAKICLQNSIAIPLIVISGLCFAGCFAGRSLSPSLLRLPRLFSALTVPLWVIFAPVCRAFGRLISVAGLPLFALQTRAKRTFEGAYVAFCHVAVLAWDASKVMLQAARFGLFPRNDLQLYPPFPKAANYSAYQAIQSTSDTCKGDNLQ